jgi:hypothetical protein
MCDVFANGSFNFIFLPFPPPLFFVYPVPLERPQGTGRVSGKVAKDVVSVAGLTAASQAFGSVSNKSDEFVKQPNDGLIGMAFGTIAQSRQPTFFENLIKQREVVAPLFSVHLTRHVERGSSVRFFFSPPSPCCPVVVR